LTVRGLIISSLVATVASSAPAGAAAAPTSPATGAGTTTTTPSATTTPATSTPPTPTGPAPSTPPAQKPVVPTVRTRITSLPSSTISDGTAPLRVRLSSVPSPDSPAPSLTPSVAGKWTVRENAEYFTPSSTLEPCTTYTLTIWSKTVATGHLPLGKRRTLSLRVGCPSLRGLQQSLMRLSYLPYELRSPHNTNGGSSPEPRRLAAHYAYHPAPDRLVASVPHAPGLRYGSLDPTTRGALMVFQGDHGLSVTGSPDDATWASLLAAETLGHDNPDPYTFVTVSETIPETLEVHRGHHIALTTPANTGVAGATTEQGTFPIYSRYVATTMTGTNPDGSKYSDPGVPWVNYFNGGDAVHGFPRPSYGTPQSNGCVELPIGTAEKVFRLLAIGDLVIVS
jgi:hypothetical protein